MSSRNIWVAAVCLLSPLSLQAVTTLGNPTQYELAIGSAFAGIARLDGVSGSCSGSLIADNIILTAAHCLQSNLTITFSDATGSPVYTAIQQIGNPLFGGTNNPINDIALVVLNTNV